MTAKRIRSLAIVFGAFFILNRLFVPSTPLLARLCVKPVCLQGEWPHLRIISCPQARSAITRLSLPSLIGWSPNLIIVADDGSLVGIVTLLASWVILNSMSRRPCFRAQKLTQKYLQDIELVVSLMCLRLGSAGSRSVSKPAKLCGDFHGHRYITKPGSDQRQTAVMQKTPTW